MPIKNDSPEAAPKTPAMQATARREPRRWCQRLIGALVAVTLGLVLTGVAQASTGYLSSPSGVSYLNWQSSQSGWTGTVSVSGTVWSRRGCAQVYEQGHNDVTGYGAWKFVTSVCNGGVGFSFSVSDYYSDSVAIMIYDTSGRRSTHVWN
jgi:hypothetical protein